MRVSRTALELSSLPSPPALRLPQPIDHSPGSNEMLCDGGQIPVGNTAQLKAENICTKALGRLCSRHLLNPKGLTAETFNPLFYSASSPDHRTHSLGQVVPFQ